MMGLLVDRVRATHIIYLDLCKAFDSVPHHILISQLERHGCDGWTTWLVKNWFYGHTQRAAVSSSMSQWRSLMSGLPQGTLLGLALFNIFVGDMDSEVKCT